MSRSDVVSFGLRLGEYKLPYSHRKHPDHRYPAGSRSQLERALGSHPRRGRRKIPGQICDVAVCPRVDCRSSGRPRNFIDTCIRQLVFNFSLSVATHRTATFSSPGRAAISASAYSRAQDRRGAGSKMRGEEAVGLQLALRELAGS